MLIVALYCRSLLSGIHHAYQVRVVLAVETQAGSERSVPYRTVLYWAVPLGGTEPLVLVDCDFSVHFGPWIQNTYLFSLVIMHKLTKHRFYPGMQWKNKRCSAALGPEAVWTGHWPFAHSFLWSWWSSPRVNISASTLSPFALSWDRVFLPQSRSISKTLRPCPTC